jgi:ribonuclease HI
MDYEGGDEDLAVKRQQVEDSANLFAEWCRSSLADDREPDFTDWEVLRALQNRPPYKSPGPDMIVGRVITAAASLIAPPFRALANGCLRLGKWPQPWKEDYAVAIPKPGKKDYTDMKAFRLLSMLSELGKAMEFLMCSRIMWRVEKRGWLDPCQHGFREGRSREAAVEDIVLKAEAAMSKQHILLVVRFDVEGAFNTAWWPHLFQKLADCQCPPSLFCLKQDFVEHRVCNLHINGYSARKRLLRGVVQGALGSPGDWNLIGKEIISAVRAQGAYPVNFADDNYLLLEAPVSDMQALLHQAAAALVGVVRHCQEFHIRFSRDPDKLGILALTRARNPDTGRGDIAFPDVVLDCEDLPEWHGLRVPVQRQARILGVIVDSKLAWHAHVNACTAKAKRLLAEASRCVRKKWGLSGAVVRQLYKGVIEPIMLNGIAIWCAALDKQVLVSKLRRVQRLAATVALRSLRTISTNAALAIAGWKPVDLEARCAAVRQYCYGPLHARLVRLGSTCQDWSPHIRFIRREAAAAGINLSWCFERTLLQHELPYPPERHIAAVQQFGSKDEWRGYTAAEQGHRVFTDGSKTEQGVGAAYAILGPLDEVLGYGTYRLPAWSTVYQAEAVALREASRWIQSQGRRFSRSWLIFTDALSVLQCLEHQHKLTTLVYSALEAASATGAMLAYVPGHRGIRGNETADALAKAAARSGKFVDVPVPKAFVQQLLRNRCSALWSLEWSSIDPDKPYRRFAPDVAAFQKCLGQDGKKASLEVRQLISGHCQLGHYLHRFAKATTALCQFCTEEDEDVAHFLLRCPRWEGIRMEVLGELLDKKRHSESLRHLLWEVDRLNDFVRRTGRLKT